MVTPVAMEPSLGYHPCVAEILTDSHDLGAGQFQAWSLTVAVSSEMVS